MRRGVALAVLLGLAVAVPAAARQQDDNVMLKVGQKVPLTTVFDKKTKYTITVSGQITVTATGYNFTYDPFFGYVASCPGKDVRPAQNFQITDEHGGILDPAAAGRPSCHSDHRYEFLINGRTFPDLVGRATASIAALAPTPGYTYSGSFTLQIKPASTEPPTCVRTYVVQPGGGRIHAQVKNTELTAKEIAAVLAKEKDKYEGWAYKPIGEPTRKVNCAGFVMLKLFGRRMVDANVDPHAFFRKIVEPFGSKRRFTTPKAGDVVVWRDHGTVQHVAFVESGGAIPRILTKDGNERPYRMKLTEVSRDEPLSQAHGDIEFWDLDPSKVSISVVAGKDCGT